MKIEYRAASESDARVIRDFQVAMAWETDARRIRVFRSP